MYLLVIKNFQFCGAISGPVIYTCYVARYLYDPCKPYSHGFMLLEKCSKYLESNSDLSSFSLSEQIGPVYWYFVCLSFYVVVLKPAGSCFFVIFQMFIIESCCLRYYLKNQLQNIIRPDKYFRKETAIKLYKQLQILVCFYNKINQDIFIVVKLSMVGLCIVIGLYAMITSWSEMRGLQYLILGSAAIQSLFGIMISYGNFGGMHDESTKLIRNLYGKPSKTADMNGIWIRQSQYIIKLIRSLQPLKVQIGAVTYIDKLTPITFASFCFSVLVNLLLLK